MDQDLENAIRTGMSLGLVNNFRTGHIGLDLLICMFIPWVVRFLFFSDNNQITQFFDSLRALCRKGGTYTRTINYSFGGSISFLPDSVDSNNRNNILQKAIKWHLSDLGISIPSAEVFLGATEKSKEFDDWGGDVFSGTYEQLQKYSLVKAPAVDHWAVVQKKGDVRFKQSFTTEESGKNSYPNRTITFELTGTSREVVDEFIQTCFDNYLEKKEKDIDSARYLYRCIKNPENQEGQEPGVLYKKYPLSDGKTFDSLFFPEKANLLKLVDDFQDKKGKFAIHGFPDKLGLLLHGPPGTGKTSLIKALAHYTQRHVVSVSLEKIKSNQQLVDAMFDLVFPVKGNDEPQLYKFSQIIFVMEDIDCASSVVYSRGGPPPSTDIPRIVVSPPAGETTAPSKEEDTAGEEKRGTKDEGKGKEGDTGDVRRGDTGGCGSPGDSNERGKGDHQSNEDGANLRTSKRGGRNSRSPSKDASLDVERKNLLESGEEWSDGETSVAESYDIESRKKEFASLEKLICVLTQGGGKEESKSGGKGGSGGKKMVGFGPAMFSEDTLTLSGLLNVLDGIIDSPGRILIMTTNHPEKLDYALIRPGRINQKVFLGYIKPPELIQMVEHYLATKLTHEYRQKATELCETRRLTPALVEQHLGEVETPAEFFEAMNTM